MVVVSFGHGAALRGRPVVHWKREELGATHACMMNERGPGVLGKVERWELVGGVDSVVARLEGGGVAGRAQIL